jgi:geranylgeranyl diphosphate synthase, type II
MQSFKDLALQFEQHFSSRHFPEHPSSLYDPAEYILGLGGKRIRPVLCLMGNELFDDIKEDAFHVASAIELFHNFSLIHDDIMDKAPLRRGKPTVHALHGESTALLAGDVMLVVSYEELIKVHHHTKKIIQLFNKTAKEVCEGQQLDMDFEKIEELKLEDYLKMISLKTSVLLASSLQLGAILGGATEGNQQHLYEFGRKLGIAFQIQDDYLDAFGDPKKFGKQVGGDILANKKTFLMIHALEEADNSDKKKLKELLHSNPPDKVEQVLSIFKNCGVDAWANELKDMYLANAFNHLEDIAVTSSRKKPLLELAHYLIERDN